MAGVGIEECGRCLDPKAVLKLTSCGSNIPHFFEDECPPHNRRHVIWTATKCFIKVGLRLSELSSVPPCLAAQEIRKRVTPVVECYGLIVILNGSIKITRHSPEMTSDRETVWSSRIEADNCIEILKRSLVFASLEQYDSAPLQRSDVPRINLDRAVKVSQHPAGVSLQSPDHRPVVVDDRVPRTKAYGGLKVLEGEIQFPLAGPRVCAVVVGVVGARVYFDGASKIRDRAVEFLFRLPRFAA
jgi:hypothetical protein